MADSPCITSVTADPREPDLRLVHCGDRCVARVRRIDVETLGLRVGEPLDASRRGQLELAGRRVALRLRAIRSLSRAAASRARLESRLATHGTEEDIGIVLDGLAEDGILDDARAAAQLVVETLRKEPVGRARLMQMLTSRGFTQDHAAHAVDAAMQDRDGHHDLEEATRRAARGLKGLPREVAARRLAGRLARRGFDEDAVAEAIRTILPE
ncbi:MAG: RecX family transcriptional regulator [Phycisphaerales bacterium]|jgi:regulatory protein|nr:RecX family transcriptional regulator [Phycisphaerales bacterium]